MQYTPGDTGGPVTSVTAVNAKGHSVITTFDPGRSLTLTVTDPNQTWAYCETYDAGSGVGYFTSAGFTPKSSGVAETTSPLSSV